MDAQTPSPAPGCDPAVVAGIQITCLRQGIGSFSAADRARSLREKILALAARPAFDPQSIVLSKSESSVDLKADNAVLLSLRDGDVAEIETMGLTIVAAGILERARAAVIADRALRRPDTLLWGAAQTVAATIALLAFLLAISRGASFVRRLIAQSDGKQIRSVRIKSFEILNSNRITAFLHWLTALAKTLLALLAFYIYVPSVLSFFPWTVQWSERLFGYIVTPFITAFRVMTDYLPNLFFLVAIVVISRYLLKVIHFFFSEIYRGNLQFEGFYRDWAFPTYKLIRVVVIAFALVMAFPYLPGSSSPAFQGVSVFLGLLLSFGSSSAISNIVAGLVLTYMRPFRVGDRIKIADTVGDVLEKNLLVTRIKTIKNVETTIPNSTVLGSHITNFSSVADREGLILHTSVTIGYDTPWRLVHELLLEAAKRTDTVDQSKSAFVLQTALNDFYVSYELNAFTRYPAQMASTYSKIHQNIQDCFKEGGVEIMSPHYEAYRDGSAITIPRDEKWEGSRNPS